MKKRYRPGIEESRAFRSAQAIENLETMRDDYIKIVRRRLADPKLKTRAKKLSIYGIAKELTDLGYRAPRSEPDADKIKGKVPYRVAKRLAEFVGEVEPLPAPVLKGPTELTVGDRIQVISIDRSFHREIGEVREVLVDEGGYHIVIDRPLKGRVLKFVRTDEVRHIPA